MMCAEVSLCAKGRTNNLEWARNVKRDINKEVYGKISNVKILLKAQ